MTAYTTTHYNFQCNIPVNEADLQKGYVSFRLDPYFVSNQWKLGSKDESGALFHCLKTISRYGDKNSVEREVNALFNQIIGLARTHGIMLSVHDWNNLVFPNELAREMTINPNGQAVSPTMIQLNKSDARYFIAGSVVFLESVINNTKLDMALANNLVQLGKKLHDTL